MIIATSICGNYLAKSATLVESVRKHHPEARFVLCLLEDELPKDETALSLYDEVVLSKDMGFDNFKSFIFRYDIREGSCSVKGQLFRYLYGKYPTEQKFLFIDPDIKIYSPLEEVVSLLDSRPIVLTPHLCEPETTMDAILDNEISALKHGAYNLGFLAVNRSDEAKRFIDWWADRLGKLCYCDLEGGVWNDQKWVDLAPCYFDVHTLKHPGYNVAPWNMSKRKIERVGEGYTANGLPLRFFHFTGLDSGANAVMVEKYAPDAANPVHEMRRTYLADLERHQQSKWGKHRWTYDTYVSGERIKSRARRAFKEDLGLIARFPNPFAESNNRILASRIKAEARQMVKDPRTFAWRFRTGRVVPLPSWS